MTFIIDAETISKAKEIFNRYLSHGIITGGRFEDDEWPVTAQSVIFVLMFFGSCAGSTAGGMKITRINIILKSVLADSK